MAPFLAAADLPVANGREAVFRPLKPNSHGCKLGGMMLHFVSRHKKLTAFSALAILIFAILAWDASAFLRGQIVARCAP
jgi:hypothetical protein